MAFANIAIEGKTVRMEQPLAEQEPPYRRISQGEAAGPYQAFPDACRLQNGDILAVFYAGYGHVSLPNAEWPKGGRICYVRSSDEGVRDGAAILYDDGMTTETRTSLSSRRTMILRFFTAPAGKWRPYQVVEPRWPSRTMGA